MSDLDDKDAPRWHERFAKRCNNRAWELSVQPRTPLQDREMLEIAHASAWHWSQIGTELNHMRSTMLLAAALSAIADEEDRKIVAETFRQVPPA